MSIHASIRGVNDPIDVFKDQIFRAARLGVAHSSDLFIPREGVVSLKSMSRSLLNAGDHCSLSRFCYIALRDVESLGIVDSDTARSLERMWRNVGDLVLSTRYDPKLMESDESSGSTYERESFTRNEDGKNPHFLTARHRTIAWVLRCKIEHVLRNVNKTIAPAYAVRDPLRQQSRLVGDAELGQWLEHQNLVHKSLLVYKEGVVGHKIDTMDLFSFWQTIRTLTAAWVQLTPCPYLYAFFNKLFSRCAFFYAYREPANSSTSTGRYQKSLQRGANRKILGLPADRWTGGPGTARASVPSLLNMKKLTSTTSGFVHINRLFVQETELIFSSMERTLRCISGFCQHPFDADCLACTEIDRVDVTGLKHFIAGMMVGQYKQTIREKFTTLIYRQYLTPGEAERFRAANRNDVCSARSILSTERSPLYKKIQIDLIQPQLHQVWASVCDNPGHPAHTLLAALACTFGLQNMADGAELNDYLVDASFLEPYLYNSERLDVPRNLFNGVYEEGRSTGTFIFHKKLKRAHGTSVPSKYLTHPHAMIIRSMDGHGLLYKGVLHPVAGGFMTVFSAWIAVMCSDDIICGLTGTGTSLFEAWKDMVCTEDRLQEVDAMHNALKTLEDEWNPVKHLFNCEDELSLLRLGPPDGQFS